LIDMSVTWWSRIEGPRLAQGDLIPDCLLPVFTGNISDGTIEEVVQRARLIVVTQSCDLENRKVAFVALCPLHTLPEFEATNRTFVEKIGWEQVRKGRVEGLHLLASPETPSDNRHAYIVDFGHIVSIPFDYLEQHAAAIGHRWRLEPPFLEHFSQAFARFFMRVGLPSAIAPYGKK
jgi:hypothetical protein